MSQTHQGSTEAMSLEDRPNLCQNLPQTVAEEDACCSSIDCCCDSDSGSCCEKEDSCNDDTSWSYYYQGMMWHWAKFREFMAKFYYYQQYYQYDRFSKHNFECAKENQCKEQCSVDCPECRSWLYQTTGYGHGRESRLNARKDNLHDSLKRSWKDRSPGNMNQHKGFHNEGRTAKRVKRPRNTGENFNKSQNNHNGCLRTSDESSTESDHDEILHQNDDEDFEMELNEEFKRFLEISQKHRRDRGEFIIASQLPIIVIA